MGELRYTDEERLADQQGQLTNPVEPPQFVKVNMPLLHDTLISAQHIVPTLLEKRCLVLATSEVSTSTTVAEAAKVFASSLMGAQIDDLWVYELGLLDWGRERLLLVVEDA